MEIEGRLSESRTRVEANGHRKEEEIGAGTEPIKNKVLTGDIYLSVVIPAYNEEQRLPITLPQVLDWLESQDYRSEVLVVDDGSEDGTTGQVEEIINRRNNGENKPACQLRLLKNDHRGKAFAVRTGMLAGQGQYILFSDADFSTPIADVTKLLAWLEKGYDIAIGSREGSGAHRYNEPFYRHLMGRVFNLFVRFVTFSRFHDTQCGFKAFTRQAAQDIFKSVHLYSEGTRKIKGAMVTGFDVEILFLAGKKGYRVREEPVEWYHVKGSKVNPLKDTVRLILDTLKVRLNDLRGQYK